MRVSSVVSVVDQTDNHRHVCHIRDDDTGILNFVKAWYIFPLHLLACALFVVVMLIWIDDHGFLTNSDAFNTRSLKQDGLYQTEVNALVSLALVLIRLIAAVGSSLIIWRLVGVLLETCGLTLKELLLVVSYRLPITPRFESSNQFIWSLLAVLVITLSLPASLSAPLANSSLAWIPSSKLASSPRFVEIRGVGKPGASRGDDAFGNFTRWPEDRWRPIVQATLGATIENDYAFTNDTLPVRRLFTMDGRIPITSSVDLRMPFIDVKLKWIDGGPHDRRFRWLGNRDYITASGIKIDDTGVGGVFFYRDEVFDASKSRPRNATVFEGKKYVLVKTARLFHDTPMPDGSLSDENTLCPTEHASLGKLPDVQTADFAVSYNGTFDVRECLHVAEAEIRAGVRYMKDCNVTFSSDTQSIATCDVKNSEVSIEKDFLVNLSLDVMSEVIRNLRPLNTTSRYMEKGIDAYTIGMLRLAYHSAWSGLTNDLGRSTETISIKTATPVVRASVARSRLYVWLATHLALEVSAILLFAVLKWTGIKAIRDPALAALTLDISDVSHSDDALGLCNAVSLNEKDKELVRLMFMARIGGGCEEREGMSLGRGCVRRVGFVEKVRDK